MLNTYMLPLAVTLVMITAGCKKNKSEGTPQKQETVTQERVSGVMPTQVAWDAEDLK